jgi:hypothetical protein
VEGKRELIEAGVAQRCAIRRVRGTHTTMIPMVIADDRDVVRIQRSSCFTVARRRFGNTPFSQWTRVMNESNKRH